MNELIEKILDKDQEGIVETISKSPELMDSVSKSGMGPVELARATGNTYVYVTLLRNTKVHSCYQIDWYKLLTEYISQISSDWFCSSWNHDIEFQVWYSLNENCPFESDWCILELSDEMKKDLRYLSLMIDGWVLYGGGKVVPIGEWGKTYSEWLIKNG